MTDKHVRRSGDDYAVALANLLPTGQAWSRNRDGTLMRVVRGLAQIYGRVDGAAADFLEIEADPRITAALLEDWERNWGLPDLCLAEPLTVDARRTALIIRMTELGAQSREYFVSLAARIGYAIRITEYAPFMVGVSEVGDTRDQWDDPRWEIGQEEIRFYWTVHVNTARLSWFRMASGELGVDHHLEIGLATDLECILRRNKPAHTDIIFDYSGLASGGAMAGTP